MRDNGGFDQSGHDRENEHNSNTNTTVAPCTVLQNLHLLIYLGSCIQYLNHLITFITFNNNPMRNYNYTDFTAIEEKHSEFKQCLETTHIITDEGDEKVQPTEKSEAMAHT